MDYYDILQKTLKRHFIKEVMSNIEQNGLNEGQGILITFFLHYKGVIFPKNVDYDNSGKVTIILQKVFWDLKISLKDFSVVLSFNDKTFMVMIPFDSILVFADLSQNFLLKFTLTNKKSKNGALNEELLDELDDDSDEDEDDDDDDDDEDDEDAEDDNHAENFSQNTKNADHIDISNVITYDFKKNKKK
jgi:hypothetical protein